MNSKVLTTFPRVLLVSDSCPNTSQGTGAALIKHFAAYPKACLRSAYLDSGDPAPEAWKGASFSLDEPCAPLCRAARVFGPNPRVRLRFALVGPRWRASAQAILNDFHPDVIYSIPFTENGLYLSRLFAQLSPRTPVALHLFDWMPRTSRGIAEDLLRDVASFATRRWALGDNLTDFATQLTNRDFITVPICHGTISPRPACQTWSAGAPFRACIIGNIWSRSAFFRMCDAWESLQVRYPHLGPIEWAASPQTLAHGWKDVLAEVRFSRIVRYAGFLTGAPLTAFLQQFNVSFVPFATEQDATTPYARYSVPSRFTELACCGVPMMAITPPETGFGRFLKSNGIANIAGQPAHTTAAIVEMLDARIRKPDVSVEISRALHDYATAHCDIARYRDFLYRELAAVASEAHTADNRPSS
jgi:hypothetical protein